MVQQMHLKIVAFCLVLGVAADVSAGKPQVTPAIAATIQLDHPKVALGQPVDVHVLLNFDAAEPAALQGKKRQKINLSLVLDRSGSMQSKGKLGYAKQAAAQVIDLLKPTDMVSVVQYDDTVVVAWPAAPLTAPGLVKSAINQLSPGGSTNLTGGMMQGVDEVAKNLNTRTLNRVILLSDGLANHGITKPGPIMKLVSAAQSRGIKISTMGLGADYNEDLMQAIAEHAGGNYYFIESPTQIARIFHQEMFAIAKAVAKDISVSLTLADAAMAVPQVYGYTAVHKGQKTTMVQADMYATEKRAMLLKLQVHPKKLGVQRLGTLRVAYFDLIKQRQVVQTQHLSIDVTNNTQAISAAENARVVVEATLIQAEQAHQGAVADYEKGQLASAKAKIKKLSSSLRKKNKKYKNIKLQKKLEALSLEEEQMRQAASSAQSRAVYLKKSKMGIRQAQKGKRNRYMQQQGNRGYEVERLQRALQDAGFYRGPIDGMYDVRVTRAVTAYQKKHGLHADGVAGPRTLQKLALY